MAARRALCISDIMVTFDGVVRRHKWLCMAAPAPGNSGLRLPRCRSARGFARRFYVKGEAASTRLRARYGALRRAKGPNCKAANLPGPHARRKTGAPTGPRRAVERSIYRTLAPLAPGTHEPVSQEGGQPNVQSEACATRLSTVRRARHREAAPRDAVAAPARSLARDPAQKGSQTSAGKWAAATNQPETPRPHTTRPPQPG